MGINLTGYGVGIDGTLVFLRTIFQPQQQQHWQQQKGGEGPPGGLAGQPSFEGLPLCSAVGGSFLFCFAAAQLMFEIRRSQQRHHERHSWTTTTTTTAALPTDASKGS